MNDDTKSIPELRGEQPAILAAWDAEEGLRPGTKVGRYLVLYRLGRGGACEQARSVFSTPKKSFAATSEAVISLISPQLSCPP